MAARTNWTSVSQMSVLFGMTHCELMHKGPIYNKTSGEIDLRSTFVPFHFKMKGLKDGDTWSGAFWLVVDPLKECQAEVNRTDNYAGFPVEVLISGQKEREMSGASALGYEKCHVVPGLATNSFFCFLFVKGQINDPSLGNTILFRSSQQLPRLCLEPSTRLVRCFRNYKDTRTPSGCAGLGA